MSEMAVSIKQVALRYGDFSALDNINLSVPAGTFTAVVGPNGAGKSTLLNILVGLTRPTSGEVRIFGQLPGEYPAEWLGFVPQLKTMDRTFPALAIELVATGLRRRWPWRLRGPEADQSMAMLKRVGAAHVATRPVRQLSGGEMQRVYLARSLVRNPRIIILDEPAAGMDMAGEAELYHILEAYQKDHNTTVIMVTHDWEGARYHASHVLLMNRAVVAFDTPDIALEEQRMLHVFGHAGHLKKTHLKGNGHG
ncbi:MAG: ABC transporter [Candidatus Hydrogenedentota bacterium]